MLTIAKKEKKKKELTKMKKNKVDKNKDASVAVAYR
jgi:hypothetical protein